MAIEQKIAALKQALQDMMQHVDINNLSDEDEGLIAQALEHVSSRISQLRKEQTSPNPTPAQQLLWQLAGGNIDAFVNYLHTIPDPELNQLLGNPDELDNVITKLHQAMPKGEPSVQDGIQQAGIQSSNIYGFQYDPRTQKLLVRFQGGPIYAYSGVPKVIFQIFQEGAVPAKTFGKNRFGKFWRGKKPSLGASFYELIRKGGYPFTRLR